MLGFRVWIGPSLEALANDGQVAEQRVHVALQRQRCHLEDGGKQADLAFAGHETGVIASICR